MRPAGMFTIGRGDTEGNIAPETAFEDLLDDWICPICSVGTDKFEKAA